MSAVMNRIGFLGGSDAKKIIEGNWLALYEEKVGIRQPEDLSGVFRVQLGSFTEPFHAGWLVDQLGMDIMNPQARYIHPAHPWMQGAVDGWWGEKQTFIELKHTNARANVRSMTDTYLPQIAHYCLCAGRGHGYISFIAGNEDPVIAKIEPSPAYLDELVALEVAFWWHVENKVAPDQHMHAEQFAEVNAQAKNVKVDGMRFVDMTGNNHWADLALALIETKDARDSHEQAKDELKKLVDKDVAEAEGHGICIKRDKRGALRITIGKEN